MTDLDFEILISVMEYLRKILQSKKKPTKFVLLIYKVKQKNMHILYNKAFYGSNKKYLHLKNKCPLRPGPPAPLG